MGSEAEDALSREKPVHEVQVSDFYLAEFPLTQLLWQAVMATDPSHFNGAALPVEQISWEDSQAFIHKLNQLTQKQYRLPTEAEWEYAARGGSLSKDGFYYQRDFLPDIGWFNTNSDRQTHPVGQKHPNELGLYDMNGNVWEWCEDDYFGTYHDAPSDGRAWIDEPQRAYRRVLRGGSWVFHIDEYRVSSRGLFLPTNRFQDIGMRLAMSVG